MKLVTISADVYASEEAVGNWYRLYVDSELLTERTFIWDSHAVYISEQLMVNLFQGTHHLTCESAISGGFELRNIIVDGQPSSWSFTI